MPDHPHKHGVKMRSSFTTTGHAWPYRRFVIGRTLLAGGRWQVKNLRYSRLQVCATGAASTLCTYKSEAWNNQRLKARRRFGPTAASDSQAGASHRFSLLRSPLTPALSRGEREKRSPRGEASSALDFSPRVRLLFPLPPGEGKREGEPQKLRARVSNHSRNRRTP